MNFKSLIFKLLKKGRLTYTLNSEISRSAKINAGTEIVNSKMNDYSYCGYDCKIIYAEIGKYCSIASNVVIGGANHPMEWVSTSPVFIKGRNTLGVNFSQKEFESYEKVIIGNDVWIGECVKIKSGVTIGDGAVVGMGSVITHDISPYTIVAGCPAKIIRKRFDDEKIEKLLKMKWWDWSESKIEQNVQYIDDIDKWFDVNGY